MPFERFDRSKAVLGRDPNVTIQVKGIISINQSAYHRIGEPKFVDLFYDPEQQLIGIAPTEDTENGHKVRVADRPGSSAVVSGTAFTKYYDIPTEQTLRWVPEFDGSMMIIDLKTPGRPIGTGRAPRRGYFPEED